MSTAVTSSQRMWLKRAGFVGFAFFFIKGLLWIAAGMIFYTLT